ncbi:MAG: hypothetical protein U9P12_01480, partial [Verrucomicrobiota bacterium]|nr:hypothetical protein [Verrucomicrobiota bacterium]
MVSATDVREENPAQGAPAALPDPVRLVSSARFYTEALLVPPGIAARDLHGFLEGEVEELSMFPLEATAWGYLDGRRKSGGAILLYAAFREHVNGATDPDSARRFAVLPGFAALLGRQWRKATWVVLVEPECVSLVRIPVRATVPDHVRCRYGTRLDEHPDVAWALRAELLESAPCADGDRVEDGLVRCGTPAIDRRGTIRFPLEQQRQPEASWKRFGAGRIGPSAVLLAADVRDRQFLLEERGRSRAIRQLRGFLRLSVLAMLLLAVFQYQYMRRSRETATLVTQVKAQRSAVEALQEQEALAKSAARLSEPPLEIFDWLVAVNEFRPETIAFH